MFGALTTLLGVSKHPREVYPHIFSAIVIFTAESVPCDLCSVKPNLGASIYIYVVLAIHGTLVTSVILSAVSYCLGFWCGGARLKVRGGYQPQLIIEAPIPATLLLHGVFYR